MDRHPRKRLKLQLPWGDWLDFLDAAIESRFLEAAKHTNDRAFVSDVENLAHDIETLVDLVKFADQDFSVHQVPLNAQRDRVRYYFRDRRKILQRLKKVAVAHYDLACSTAFVTPEEGGGQIRRAYVDPRRHKELLARIDQLLETPEKHAMEHIRELDEMIKRGPVSRKKKRPVDRRITTHGRRPDGLD